MILNGFGITEWRRRRRNHNISGSDTIEAQNIAKSTLLYAAIDGSKGFYRNPVRVADRSRMNVPFTLADAALDSVFLKESAAAGLMHLKGHKSVGGMRASIYNPISLAGVEALVEFMRGFAARAMVEERHQDV